MKREDLPAGDEIVRYVKPSMIQEDGTADGSDFRLRSARPDETGLSVNWLDAGSGESEIRRFILENDLLEALIALPEQLFYNTGIATCVWLLTNRKAPERRGLVQLIDATAF